MLGADVNFRTSKEKHTPLHVAVKHGHGDTVVELLKHGADPSLTDGSGLLAKDLTKDPAILHLLESTPGIILSRALSYFLLSLSFVHIACSLAPYYVIDPFFFCSRSPECVSLASDFESHGSALQFEPSAFRLGSVYPLTARYVVDLC